MTRAGALPHRVTLRHKTAGAVDARNNVELEVEWAAGDIPARVDLLTAAGQSGEDIDDRDQVTERYRITIPAQWAGRDLTVLDAHDELVFEGRTLQVQGPPARADDHAGRIDHVELAAYRIRG